MGVPPVRRHPFFSAVTGRTFVLPCPAGHARVAAMTKTAIFLLCASLPLSVFASSCGQLQSVSGLPRHDVPATPAKVAPQQRARHIILMIGDGMGPEHVWAGWAGNGGKLNLERLPVIGMSRTSSASHAITDSAAGGTAIACGERTSNGTVGQSSEGKPFTSIARRLRAEGYATGLVVTKSITDATPAAFYASAASRKQTSRIASQLPDAGFSVVLGGGADDVPAAAVQRMREGGALVELDAPHELPPATKRGDYLPKAVERALGVLEKDDRPFFLMVEGSQIDVAAHWNDLNEVVAEVMDFDRTLGVVLRWMEKHPDTLLVVTADHQTGGLSIHDANAEKGSVSGSFSTLQHSGLAVPVYAAGAGAERFRGIFDNRDITGKLMDARRSAGAAKAE